MCGPGRGRVGRRGWCRRDLPSILLKLRNDLAKVADVPLIFFLGVDGRSYCVFMCVYTNMYFFSAFSIHAISTYLGASSSPIQQDVMSGCNNNSLGEGEDDFTSSLRAELDEQVAPAPGHILHVINFRPTLRGVPIMHAVWLPSDVLGHNSA